MGNGVPGGRRPVSSPGISPSSHTDHARLNPLPAPCTNTHTKTLTAMMAYVTYEVLSATFSSWYGNIGFPPGWAAALGLATLV
jgi:hypothetical protein